MGRIVIGKSLGIDRCQIGMKTGEDTRNRHGSIIVPQGTILTEEIINRLIKYKVERVTIVDKELDNNLDFNNSQSVIIEDKIKESDGNVGNRKYMPSIDVQSNYLYKSNVRAINGIFDEVQKGKSLEYLKIKEIALVIFNEVMDGNKLLVCLELLKKKGINTYSHSVNTAVLSGMLGKWMELNKIRVFNLIMGGLLHDIGLSDIMKEDEKLLKQHPLLAYELVLKIKEIDISVKNMILTHHENCDGSGYPFGLGIDKLPLESKILSVVDRFDEIYSNSDINDNNILLALEKLYEDQLTKLDFKALHVFIKNMLWNHLGRHVKLKDGRVGEIVFINGLNKFKSMIKIDSEVIDLSTNREIEIMDVL